MLFGCRGRDPEPGDPCDQLADCVGEQELACSLNECRRLSCVRTAECPAEAACVSGLCQLPECGADGDCGARQRCWEGDCRFDICEFKAECDPGLVCIGEPPTCKLPPGRCESDRDCPNDTACKLPEQSCEAPCASDAACADGEYCDGEFCRLSCRTSSDCGDEEVCIDGRCDVDRCGQTSCPADLPFVEPSECQCVACLSDRDCASERGERCSVANECVFCLAKAEDSSVCSAQGLFLKDGCCVECTVDPHCPDGTVCTDGGRCVVPDPRECVADGDCSAGAICDLGWCIIPGSGAPCAAQADCVSGEACYSDGRCRAESDVCGECDSPGRCVAEPGDVTGTCAGCTENCAPTGCPAGSVCYVPDGVNEGYCALEQLVSCP